MKMQQLWGEKLKASVVITAGFPALKKYHYHLAAQHLNCKIESH